MTSLIEAGVNEAVAVRPFPLIARNFTSLIVVPAVSFVFIPFK